MIAVRTMRQQDVEEVVTLEREIFSQPWSTAGFLDALKLDNTVFLAAEEHGHIVGYIGMYLSVEEGEITNVAVAPRERCRGIGGMLLDEIKKEAGVHSVEKIVLEVRRSNDSAIRLYERSGFTIRGIRKGFYEFPKEDAYIMIYGQ